MVFNFSRAVKIFFLSPNRVISPGQHLVECSWPIAVIPIWTKQLLPKPLQVILMCMRTHRDHRPLLIDWFSVVISGDHRNIKGSLSSSSEYTARWRQFLGQQDGGML